MKGPLISLLEDIAPHLGKREYGNLRLLRGEHAPVLKQQNPASFLLFGYEHFVNSSRITGVALHRGRYVHTAMTNVLGHENPHAVEQLREELARIPDIRHYHLLHHYDEAREYAQNQGVSLADFYTAAELARVRRSINHAA